MCKFMQSCWRLVGDESYLDEHTDSNLSQMQVQISNPPLLGWYVEQVKSEVLFWTHKKFTPLIWPRCFSNQLPSTSSQIPQKKPVMRHFCPRKGGSSVLERKNALVVHRPSLGRSGRQGLFSKICQLTQWQALHRFAQLGISKYQPTMHEEGDGGFFALAHVDRARI